MGSEQTLSRMNTVLAIVLLGAAYASAEAGYLHRGYGYGGYYGGYGGYEDMNISERDLLMLKLSQDTLAGGIEVMAMVVSAMVVMVGIMDVDTTARERLKQ